MTRHTSLLRPFAVAFPLALVLASSGACSSDETPNDDGVDAPGGAGAGGSTDAEMPATPGPGPAGSTTAPTMAPTTDPGVPSGSAPGGTGGNANSGGTGSMAPQGGAGGSGGEANAGGAGPVGGTGGGAGAGGGDGGQAPMGGTSPGGSSAGGMSGGGAGGMSGGGGVGGSAPSDPNSPGCGTPLTRPDRNVQQTMELGGTTRYYLLDVPQNADNQTPLMLIFGLHGFDMNNVAVKDLYNFTSRSNGQAITVMPQGEGPPPGDVSHWGDGVLESTWSPNQANYDYIEALIETIGENYCIDNNRVFIVGFSMGAFFTNAIACAHNDWFRGFAPIAGGGPSMCGDGIQSAIIVQHGTVDPIVDISSGEGSRDIWLEQNGCSQSSSPTLDGCQAYDGCPDGKPLLWCTGNYDHYIPEQVTSNIWSFFSSL